MAVYLSIIVLSIALIAAVLLQGKGGGLSGGLFGGGESMYGTRRGVEKTLFNVTIGLMIALIVFDLIAVLFTG
ncbi:MAG: preprotein translocase subunit SecG [Ardenticatenales bacterium]|nr:preprotein translocase subunit SecG [Ardenticatenales bacterium]